MGRKKKINLAIQQLNEYFKNSLETNCFTHRDLESLLVQIKETIDLGTKTTTDTFIEALVLNNILTEHKVTFDKNYSNKSIYTKETVATEEALFHLFPEQHISFYSAMVYHNLTEQTPSKLYLRQAYPNRSSTGHIENQTAIDIAMSKEPRATGKIGKIMLDPKLEIVFTLGNENCNTHVIPTKINNFKVTDLEMTLIDALVKPEYCGGVWEVLKAFETARSRISIDTLITYLNELEYAYPYHQRLGFYLMYSKHPDLKTLKKIKDIEQKWRFYLATGMKEIEYNKEWNLYIPKAMKI
jgi:predicted transcriptional regulator of viral defense system